MAEENNIRSFSYDIPTYYNGAKYPSRVTTVENGMAVPVIMSGEVPEVVVTASKGNTISQKFNDYLAINNDATYMSKPLTFKPIKPDLSFSAVLKRATKPYSNYSEALDAPFSEEKEDLVNAARYIKDNYVEDFPTRSSNCTLSAT